MKARERSLAVNLGDAAAELEGGPTDGATEIEGDLVSGILEVEERLHGARGKLEAAPVCEEGERFVPLATSP